MENTEKSSGMGAIMGAVIIIVILAVGAWYFIGNRVEKIEVQKQATKTMDVSSGLSTEVVDIQEDLNNLDLNSLNQ